LFFGVNLTSAVAVCGSHSLDRVPERISFSSVPLDHERSSPCVPTLQSGPPLFCFGKCWPSAANAQTSGSGECMWTPQNLWIGALLTLSNQTSCRKCITTVSERCDERRPRAEKQDLCSPTMCDWGIDILVACNHRSTRNFLQ
jgi:hypothetical protein